MTSDQRVKQAFVLKRGHSQGRVKKIQRIVHKKQQVKNTCNRMTSCNASRKNYRKIGNAAESHLVSVSS